MTKLRVGPVTRNTVKPYLLGIHYAGRMPSISYAFGLFDGDDLIGVVTYGSPAGAPQREGLLGKEYAGIVLELNRLCLKYNRKNEASFLVANSLKMLPRPRVIISYADSAQGHVGTVYQASNSIYLGLSEKRTDWSLRSKPHLHGQTIADEFRGQPNRAALMRAKYGDDFYLKPRPRKHRYVFIIGSKKERRDLRKAIRYTEQPYPKEASMNLTQLPQALADLVATVQPSTVLALITEDTPSDVATRLRILATDYPDGIPAELVDLERRRVTELAHMVGEGLV